MLPTFLLIAYFGNLIDIMTTLTLIEQGFYELNPVMRPLLDYPGLFATVKIVAMTGICLFLWKRRTDKHALPIAVFAAIVYGSIAVYYTIIGTFML